MVEGTGLHWVEVFGNLLLMFRRGESLLMPAMVKAKAGKKVVKPWVIGSRMLSVV